MDHHIIKSIVTFRSCHRPPFPEFRQFKNLLLDDAFLPTGVSNLVFLNYIFVAREANLILSREGYRTDCH